MKPTWASLALCLTMLLGLTACTDDADKSSDPGTTPSEQAESSSEAEAPKPGRRPKVGDCHRLNWDDALAPTPPDKRVKCTKKPTSVTFYVGRIKRDANGAPLPVDSDAVQKQVTRVCTARLAKRLGGNKDLLRRTLLKTVWFTPTLEQEAAGADWFRCDLVAPLSGRRLLVLQPPMQGVLNDPQRRERYALCATGEPGKKSFTRTTCGSAHDWRAVRTVDIAGKKYPGKKAVAAAMDRACSDAATDAASNPLKVRWSQEGPTRKQWNAGRRYGICWVPS